MSKVNETDEKIGVPKPAESVSKARLGPELKFEEDGHLIARSRAERVKDHQAFLRTLDEMTTVLDDPPGSDEDLWPAIDAVRPDRPLFRECDQP